MNKIAILILTNNSIGILRKCYFLLLFLNTIIGVFMDLDTTGNGQTCEITDPIKFKI